MLSIAELPQTNLASEGIWPPGLNDSGACVEIDASCTAQVFDAAGDASGVRHGHGTWGR